MQNFDKNTVDFTKNESLQCEKQLSYRITLTSNLKWKKFYNEEVEKIQDDFTTIRHIITDDKKDFLAENALFNESTRIVANLGNYLLNEKLADSKKILSWSNDGIILYIKDAVLVVNNLQKITFGELVKFPSTTNIYAIIMTMTKKHVSASISANSAMLGSGDRVQRTGNLVSITNAGWYYLGRVIDSLGNTIDGRGGIDKINEKGLRVDIKAPGIVYRDSVNEPVITGIKMIDAMIPLGRGQRELILGDRGTGKTSIIVDIILAQRFRQNSFYRLKKVYCIFVMIGQKKATIMPIVRILTLTGAIKYTSIVASAAADAAPMQYLTPFTGSTVAEFFRDNQMHSLIFSDDLTRQAVSYRQMSLLLRRPPGREAFPGDVFYLHSRLLERAAKLCDILGSGSMTAVPVIETLEGDISAYIPTNVISITDGQIFLDKGLYNRNILPAINLGLSVSRVGSSAQIDLPKKYASSLKLELSQFKEVETFASYSSDSDNLTLKTIERGLRWVEILKQQKYNPVQIELQIFLSYTGSTGGFDDIPVKSIPDFLEIINFIWHQFITRYVLENSFGIGETAVKALFMTIYKRAKMWFTKLGKEKTLNLIITPDIRKHFAERFIYNLYFIDPNITLQE